MFIQASQNNEQSLIIQANGHPIPKDTTIRCLNEKIRDRNEQADKTENF